MHTDELSRLRHRAFDAAKSGVVIVDVTAPDQPIIDMNAGFEQLTGYSRAEAVGRNCRFLHGPGTDVDAKRRIREAIAHRREVTVTLLNYRRDGVPFWNELHLSPLADGDGVVRHFVGIQTDVTRGWRAVKRAEVLAQASMVLGSSLDYAKTVEGVARLTVPEIADWCAVDLLEDDASIRRLVSIYHDAEDPEEAWDVEERHLLLANSPDGPAAVVRDGEPELIVYLPDEPPSAQSEHRVYLKQQRLVSAMTVPMTTRGRTIGALTLATGDSGRRYGPEDLALAQDLGSRAALAIDNARLFASAQAAIRTRDQFLSTAAHELRTPVASIKGYAQLLLRAQQRDTLTPERMRRSLHTIDQATDRLAILTDDLLDVSRIRLGQLPLRIRRLEFRALVQDLIQRHGEAFGTAHPISLVLSDDPCWVDVDPDRIQQVLTNLIDNAVKHSAEAEAIEVTIAHGESRISCEIRDSGIGLSPGAAGGLFEPFARAPNAVNLNVPGLGLGLYICRGIIERHGGEIWAESAGEGLGAKFGFSLPCHRDPASEH